MIHSHRKKSRFQLFIICIPLLFMVNCENADELEQEESEFEPEPKAASLCNLKDFGPEYITSGIGEPGFSEDAATTISNSAIGKLNTASVGFLRSSLGILSGLSKGEDAAAKMSAILGNPASTAVLGSLKAVPYIGVAIDFIKMFMELSGSACDNTGAVAGFVKDSISVAYNELQQRNWDQDDENSLDELNDISIATESVIFSDQSLLNQMDYINDNLIDSATISSYKTLYESGMLDLANNLLAYKSRIENKLSKTDAANWVLVSAVAYSQLIQWYLASMKAHLISTRGIAIEQYNTKHKCSNSATKDVSECLKVAAMQSNAGLQYATFRNVVNQLKILADRIYSASAQASAYRVEYNCPEGTCWGRNDDNWKISLKNGDVRQYLWDKHLMTYSKAQSYELDYTAITNLLPSDVRRNVPTAIKYCYPRGYKRPCNFDLDSVWPGKYVQKPGPKGSTYNVWVPHNKYLGKGEDGFWRYLLNPKSQGGLDLLSAYYEIKDSQVAGSSNKIKALNTATKDEYGKLKNVLAGIQNGLSGCTNDNKYSSMRDCSYFIDPVMDFIKKELHYAGVKQSASTETNAVIPGTIQAEKYDKGGSGVAYYDTTGGNVDTSSEQIGSNSATVVSGIAPGEWLEYTTNISEGTYKINLTYKATKTNSWKGFAIYVDGQRVATLRQDEIVGWTTKTVASDVKLAGGNNKVVRIRSSGDGYQLDKIAFIK